MQGVLRHLDSISLAGYKAGSLGFEALRHMPGLQILILDGVKSANMLSGFQIPNLAMLSWQGASGRSLPVDLQAAKSAAVLDISGSDELVRLPTDRQASTFLIRCL